MRANGKQRIALVGGGSGGHFYPLIAIAERLNDTKASGRDLTLYYLGPEPYQADALAQANINFIRIPAGKRRKYFSPLNFLDPFKTLGGFLVALYRLYWLYPDTVMSKGGYTSVPVILAAWLLRIPIVIHESDTKPGSANRLAARFARYIGIAFAEVAQYFPAGKVALVGIPIRRALMVPIANPHSALGIDATRPVIFVTGGSLGALRINHLILETLDELLPAYTIIHQTGSAHETTVRRSAAELISDQALLSHYFAKGTLSGEEMRLALAAAAIVISRAGSTTIFEIAQHGKPAIIIPIPEEVSHDQRSNAYAYARTGAASVLEEGNLTDGLLTAEINRIMADNARYAAMAAAATQFAAQDAAAAIAAVLLTIVDEHV